MYFYHPSNVDSSALQQSSVITSKSFYKKVVNKLTYLSRLMSIGFRVLYMDCDIILFKESLGLFLISIRKRILMLLLRRMIR